MKKHWEFKPSLGLNRLKTALFFFWFLFFTLSAPAGAVGENEKAIARLKEKPPSQEWSFAVLGDQRYSKWIYDFMYEKTLASMSGHSFDFALNTGDFVDTGTEEEFINYLNRIRLLKFPTINILGNHDVHTHRRDLTLFKKYFGQPYFYFDYQNARFICLNNAFHEFGDAQNRWLDKTLAEAKNRLKFVFMHIPTFNPSRRPRYLIKWDNDIKLFEDIIQRNGVDIVFAGHIHMFHDTVYKGIRTIITGGAGAPLYETPERGGVYHWVRVQIKGRTIQAEPVIISPPSWWRPIYRIVFFFSFDFQDNWKVYVPVFVGGVFLLSIILLKIPRKKGKK
jgi:predicted phosphodiesterase